jgi:hypothetical protein
MKGEKEVKAQRFPRFLVLSLIMVLIAGSTVALASGLQQDGSGGVDRLVLQRNELPETAEAYYTERLTSESFPGDTASLNLLVEGKGFRRGRIVGAWYPLLRSQDQDDAREDTHHGAYVSNVAVQYKNEACATAVLKQMHESFRSQLPMDIVADVIEDYDELAVATDDLRKEYVIRLTYSQEDETWETYWSFSVRGNTLMVLMVDGQPGSANREIFDAVTNILQQQR